MIGLIAVVLQWTVIVSFSLEAQIHVRVPEEEVSVGADFQIGIDINSEESLSKVEKISSAETTLRWKDLQFIGESQQTILSQSGINTRRVFRYLVTLTVSKAGLLMVRDATLQLRGGKTLKIPQFQLQVGSAQSSNKSEPSIFVELTKSQVYVGESLELNYGIRKSGQILQILARSYPELSGFRKERIEEGLLQFPQVPLSCVEMSDGGERCGLLKYRMFPLRAGDLSVDSLAVRILRVLSGRRDSFEQNFFGGLFQMPGFGFGSRTQQWIEVESAAPTIPVLSWPLPKPNDFFGEVGQYIVHETWDDRDWESKGVLRRQIDVRSDGDLGRFSKDPAVRPDNAYVLEYKWKNEAKDRSDGKMSWEYRAKKQGLVKIPGLHFSVLDPSVKHYVSVTTPGFEKVWGTPPLPQSNPLKSSPVQEPPLSLEQEENLHPVDPPALSEYRAAQASRLIEIRKRLLPEGGGTPVSDSSMNRVIPILLLLLMPVLLIGLVLTPAVKASLRAQYEEMKQLREWKHRSLEKIEDVLQLGNEMFRAQQQWERRRSGSAPVTWPELIELWSRRIGSLETGTQLIELWMKIQAQFYQDKKNKVAISDNKPLSGEDFINFRNKILFISKQICYERISFFLTKRGSSDSESKGK